VDVQCGIAGIYGRKRSAVEVGGTFSARQSLAEDRRAGYLLYWSCPSARPGAYLIPAR